MHLDTEYLNKLRGKDLIYPNKQDFTTLYVYHRGEVLATIDITNISLEATILDAKLEELGIEVGKKGLTENIGKLPGELSSLGVTTEKVVNMKSFQHRRDQYHEVIGERIDAFRKELYEYYGVTDNPKADAVYDKAYDQGHSAGFGEVSSIFGDLVDLIV